MQNQNESEITKIGDLSPKLGEGFFFWLLTHITQKIFRINIRPMFLYVIIFYNNLSFCEIQDFHNSKFKEVTN